MHQHAVLEPSAYGTSFNQQFGHADVYVPEAHPIPGLYPKVLQDFHEINTKKSGSHYFFNLWASISPAGNIYRHLALGAECRIHSYDLQEQLLEIALEYKTILGGDTLTTEQCADLLVDLLKQTPVLCNNKDLDQAPSTGFPPLEEFLPVKVRRFGWFIYPTCSEAFKAWVGTSVLAWCMLIVQTVAPISVLVNRWDMQTNHLKDPRHLNFSDGMCLGANFVEKTETVIGTLMLILVAFMIRSYAVQEREHGRKSGTLPMHGFWMFAGNLANSCACVFLSLALPFLFWSEENVTQLVRDSVSLTFLFSLDDLPGGFCSDIGDNAMFRRSCAWRAVLLSQCPVRVADLINPHARRAKDLWQITIDEKGGLVFADGAKPDAKKGNTCETRFRFANAGTHALDEEAALLDTQKMLLYCTSPGKPSLQLPTMRTKHVIAWWSSMTYGILIYMIVVAPLFFIFNHACYD